MVHHSCGKSQNPYNSLQVPTWSAPSDTHQPLLCSSSPISSHHDQLTFPQKCHAQSHPRASAFLILYLESSSPIYLPCSLPHFLQVFPQMSLSLRDSLKPPYFKMHSLHKHPDLQHSLILFFFF